MNKFLSYLNVNLKKVIPSIVITEKLVLEKLKYLNTAKSVGPDDVHAMVLKTLSGVLCKPLAIIFSNSLKLGVLPSIWKKAIISAMYKKGSKNLPSNYRPVKSDMYTL